jgi:hypothetical protein
LHQRGHVRFADDLITNLSHGDVRSRFLIGFGQPLAETDVTVRVSATASTCHRCATASQSRSSMRQ